MSWLYKSPVRLKYPSQYRRPYVCQLMGEEWWEYNTLEMS